MRHLPDTLKSPFPQLHRTLEIALLAVHVGLTALLHMRRSQDDTSNGQTRLTQSVQKMF